MFRLIVASLSAGIVLGCSSYAPDSNHSASDGKKMMSKSINGESGLMLENIDKSVKPGDDFMAHVNGLWIKNTEIPSDKASYGIGYILHERAQEDVKRIIEETASGNFGEGSDEQKVGDLFSSYMDIERRNALGLNPLLPDLAKIDELQSHNDVVRYMAWANRIGIDVPLGFAMFEDLKQPDRYAIYFFQGGLGLPDREYYFTDDEKSEDIRIKYREHLTKMMLLTDVGGAEEADQIMQLETLMAKSHMLKEKTRDIVGLYNPYTRAELAAFTPNINWDAYFDVAGLPDLDRVIVATKDFTQDMDGILNDTPVATWKTYLKWRAISANARRLNDAMTDESFDFYGRTLTGAEEQVPLWRRGVNVVNGQLGEVVGKVYVKRHFPPEAKDKMQELVGNLIKAYEISIKDLDWMGDATRVQALDKLSKFTPKIGYPDIWKDYSAVTIKQDDLYGNYRRSQLAEYDRMLNKLKGPVLKHEWGMTPQTVNAYYNPPANEIVFPAAILQPPYFDLNADEAASYGGIGAIIGHEIGHGFDDAGSTFDGDGVLRDWWTENDKAEFKQRTAKLIDQYNSFKVFDDLNVNGEFTLGENIGDLGGLSIALKAYHLSLNGKPAPVIAGYTGDQRVFLGWAQSWLKKAREESLRQQVGTDPHSPAKFRVNGVVRNIPEFYEAFDVQPGDALYLPPEERVKIW